MRSKTVLKVLPILLFSGLFGFFLWQVYFVHNGPGSGIDWHGSWITSSELDGDVFYFRKEFNLSDNVKNAWLLISASDRFEVYLNGEYLGTGELDGWFPVGIYDVTKEIKLGINAVAVRVTKRSFEGPVKTSLEIGYEDINGKKHYVFSGETWKVSNKEERSSPFGLYWYDIGFDDVGWVNTRVLEKPRGLWLKLDPRIYSTSANGPWFWAGKQREISCRAEIDVPKKPGHAWIRLASRGGFRLLVNEKQIDVQEKIIGTQNESVQPEEISQEEILYIYEIGSFLKSGDNTISISAYAEGSRRGLYVDGIIEGDGRSETIDENNFGCFSSGESTSLQIYKGEPAWISIKNKQIIEQSWLPLGLSISLYSILIFILCISSLVFVGLTFVVSIITRLPFYSLSRAFLIPFLFLTFIYMLRYDIGLYESFPFQIKFLILSVCLLIFFWLLHPLISKIQIKDVPGWLITLTLLLILLVGAFLRFKGVSKESLQQDEAVLIIRALQVLEYGYPSIKLVPEIPNFYFSTSELVSYLQALSFIAFGTSEFSLRLPMVLFAILTIPLLYYFGKMIGGARVGLLASAIYSLLPSAIGMADFGRYPSQLTFFALLTGYLAFVYLKTDKVRYLYLCALSYLLTYFSWQGSGFMLPSLLLTLALIRIIMGKTERILKDTIVFLIIVVPPIVTHMLIRLLQSIFVGNHLVGGAASEITSPQLMFLNPFYDPFFYLSNFFFIEGHQFLSILFFTGIFLVFMRFKKYKSLLFLYMFPLVIPFLMNNLLQLNSYRYVYYLLPYLILCACGVFFIFLDYLGCDKNNRFLTFVNTAFASIMLVTLSSGVFLNLKNFPNTKQDLRTSQSLRYFPEVDKVAEFIKSNIEPGDVVVSFQPHLLEYYLDQVDYFFESRLAIAVVVFPRGSNFMSVHKYSGTTAVLTLNELKKIIGANRRVWFVATPESPYFFDEDTREFLDRNKKVLFETYKAEVYLIGSV